MFGLSHFNRPLLVQRLKPNREKPRERGYRVISRLTTRRQRRAYTPCESPVNGAGFRDAVHGRQRLQGRWLGLNLSWVEE